MEPDILFWTREAVASARFWKQTGDDWLLRFARSALNNAFAACNTAKDNRSRAQVVRMRNWINAEIRKQAV